jgi:hypothetical protein
LSGSGVGELDGLKSGREGYKPMEEENEVSSSIID